MHLTWQQFQKACFFDEGKYNDVKIPRGVLLGQTQKSCGKELNIVCFTDDTSNLSWYKAHSFLGFLSLFKTQPSPVFVKARDPPEQLRFDFAAAFGVFYLKILT